VEKAQASIANMLKFRAERKLSELRKTIGSLDHTKFPNYENIIKVWPHNVLHGSDKTGQPLSFVLAGKVRPQRMQKLLTKDQVLDYQVAVLEYGADLAAALTKKTGKVIRQIKIFDLDGLGVHFLDHGFLAYFRGITKVAQENYPEMLGRIYVVNVPWAFSIFWKLITPMLQPFTLAKIQVLGSDWKDKLKVDIDASNLPDYLGGTCSEHKSSGCVPLADPDGGYTKAVVNARDKHELKIKVEAKSELVSWEFRIESNNIAFGVKYESEADKKENVIEESSKHESSSDLISGGSKVSGPGTLTLTWDNSFSLLTGKTVFYRVDHVAESELEKTKE